MRHTSVFLLCCYTLVIITACERTKNMAQNAEEKIEKGINIGQEHYNRTKAFSQKTKQQFKDWKKEGKDFIDELGPRDGIRIYEALFDSPTSSCVEVLGYQDQVVPKIDYAIFLHFKTCPDEVERILAQHTFRKATVSGKSLATTYGVNWFRPQDLGDSVLVYQYALNEYGNGQTLYLNQTKTEGYCEDIWD